MLGGHDLSYVRIVWGVASLCGLAVLVALAIVYRRARAAVELEHAERVIAEDERDQSS